MLFMYLMLIRVFVNQVILVSDSLGQDLSVGWVWFVAFILSLAMSHHVITDLSRHCRVILRWK